MLEAVPQIRRDPYRHHTECGGMSAVNTARMMFANSEFLLMLNQATTDREQLARLLGASDTQMSYVDNAPAGHGLIKVGGAIVPFANELPKNTELYRLMSTRPGEE